MEETYYYKVAELFTSINGEGVRAGQLAQFLRFAGCNIACSYCDTAWANQPDTPVIRMSDAEILAQVRKSGITNLTVTGGEPLIQPGIIHLLEYLARTDQLRIEVETNGTAALPSSEAWGEKVTFTMDYKLPGSGMESFMCMENLTRVRTCDTVKFVVSDRQDLDRAREVILAYDLTVRCHVYLSPVFGSIDPETIVEYMKKYEMNNVNLQIQIHKVIWDPEKRGV
ncbi:MAG TPA: putative 7-carboxy-7-deazaguanine synthase QueE [Lachnospiraceae bacterium]|nr:putative 7-carboxy-7-deazaguanine synthase QueE [Lachnospiraceae bacterium]